MTLTTINTNSWNPPCSDARPLKYCIFLAMLGLHCCVGFSLDARSGGYSSLLCMGSTACGLNSCGSQVIGHRLNGCGAHRLSCSLAYGIFPDQGLNPCLLHWEVDSLPLSHQASWYIFIHITSFWHLLWLIYNLLILLGIKRNKINKKEVPKVLQIIKPESEHKCDIQSYTLFRNK